MLFEALSTYMLAKSSTDKVRYGHCLKLNKLKKLLSFSRVPRGLQNAKLAERKATFTERNHLLFFNASTIGAKATSLAAALTADTLSARLLSRCQGRRWRRAAPSSLECLR